MIMNIYFVLTISIKIATYIYSRSNVKLGYDSQYLRVVNRDSLAFYFSLIAIPHVNFWVICYIPTIYLNHKKYAN